MTLITRSGLASMTMTSIAREAGVPIGSVYQYFPERSAVLKSLFDRMNERVHVKASETFGNVRSLDHAMELVGEIIDWYYNELRDNPASIDILLGTEADKEILALKVAGLTRFSAIFAQAVQPYLPPMPGVDLDVRYFMFLHLIGSVVHLAVMTDETMAERLLEEWKNVIRCALFAPPFTSPAASVPGGIAAGAGTP